MCLLRSVLVRVAALASLLAVCFFAVAAERGAAAIYWQNDSTEIGRANLDGSNVDPEFIRFPTLPFSGGNGVTSCGEVAVDANHVYWTDNWHETIGRANLDGSEVEGAFITGANQPCGLSVDSSHIYWVNFEGETIGRANLDGTGVQQDFLDVGWRACGVAASDSYLFWSPQEGEIDRASLAGTERVAPLIPGDNVCGLTTAGERLFWTDWSGSIGRATLDGTELDPELISGLLSPCGVTVHDGKIYWAEQPFGAPGSIGRAALDGSHVERGIVANLFRPCGVAVDDRPVPPKPPPGEISLGPAIHNRRTGAIRLGVTLSIPGSLSVGMVPRAFHYRFLGSAPGQEFSAGRHWLKLSIGHGSVSSWLRRALRRTGFREFSVSIGYAPPETGAKVVRKRLTMRRPKRAR